MPQYYDRDNKSHYQKKRYLLKVYGIGKEELDIKFEKEFSYHPTRG